MATIRHIAIFSDDPDRLAEYWHDIFGFEITGKAEVGDVWVTDGYMNVALLKRKRPTAPHGIQHWGLTLDADEKDEIYAKLKERGFDIEPAQVMMVDGVVVDRPFIEDKTRDPDGNAFDLSTGIREMMKTSGPN